MPIDAGDAAIMPVAAFSRLPRMTRMQYARRCYALVSGGHGAVRSACVRMHGDSACRRGAACAARRLIFYRRRCCQFAAMLAYAMIFCRR